MGPSVPDMQLVADALAAEGVAEGAVVVEEGILGADGQHDIEPPQHGELLGAVEPRQEMRRHAEIDIVVGVAVEKIGKGLDLECQVVAPRKGDEAAEPRRLS